MKMSADGESTDKVEGKPASLPSRSTQRAKKKEWQEHRNARWSSASEPL